MTADLKKEIPTYAARRGRFDLVTVPPLAYLALDGHGDPNASDAYREAIETIYPVAYALKFLSKKELERDYAVMPLEALWWAEDMESFTGARDKTEWDWTVLNLVPEWLAEEHVAEAIARVRVKGGAPRLDEIRLERIDESLAVQTLHVGPYDAEAPVIAALHEFAAGDGLELAGKHHEIYLSDARRTAPEKLRTILRQPVARVS